jgi:RimJ/RimL family protein N-acetyltransferase
MEHCDALAPIVADDEVWRHLSIMPRHPTAESYIAEMQRQWSEGTALAFAVRHLPTDRVMGVTRFKEIERTHRGIGIGTWFAREAWGTGANAESKWLLLEYAFETLGAIRVQLDTDVRNERSRAAMAKLGFTEEGVMRAHRIRADGSLRDSILFSVIAPEWPRVREIVRARVERQTTGARSGFAE